MRCCQSLDLIRYVLCLLLDCHCSIALSSFLSDNFRQNKLVNVYEVSQSMRFNEFVKIICKHMRAGQRYCSP